MIIKPDYIANSVYEIEYDKLKENGIRVLLFDLDSTLMPSKSGEFPENILKMLNNLEKDFQIAIISNNKNMEYIQKAQAQVNIQIIPHSNKPSPKIIKEYLKTFNFSAKEAVMIGDRPLTDILAGILAGTKTVLVDSITKDSEKLIVRFVRHLERLTIHK